MRGINRVFLMGHLGCDPVVRRTPNGLAVCELSVATHRSVKKGDGWEDEVDWTRIRLWDQKAEIAMRYLTRGAPLAVEGQLRTDTWTDAQNVRHYRSVVNVEHHHLLPRAKDDQPRAKDDSARRDAPDGDPSEGEEIPF